MNYNYNIYNASAGSGKTFNIVKEYLKILINGNKLDIYKKILSITFTNKAVNEMKSRIIDGLNDLTKIQELKNKNPLLEYIKNETGLNELEIQNKATSLLKSILINYASFEVSTIDKFTQKIIRNFAYEIKLPLDYEVEINSKDILELATSNLIAQVGNNKELTDVLINFSFEKSANDKSWDIEYDLNSIAKLILNENHFSQLEQLTAKNLVDFESLKRRLDHLMTVVEGKILKEANNCLSLIYTNNLEDSDFLAKALPKHLKKIKSKNYKSLYSSQLENNIREGHLYKKTLDNSKKQVIDSIKNDIEISFLNIKKNVYKFKFYQNVQSNSRPLSILKLINLELDKIKKEKNIILISEFNKIVNDQIKNQPALFIYEKIGVKYNHFFIDEFQDTSILQWNNLTPLVENSLSSENSSLTISGDVKQAIYRWRGGDPQQLINLSNNNSDFTLDGNVINLDTNYRSKDEIINFNNSFFNYIGSSVFNSKIHENIYLNSFQKNNNDPGGYVGINFLELDDCLNKEELYCVKVQKIIEESLNNNYQLRDICILVRTNEQGVTVSDYLNKNNIEIISSETLLINKSKEVKFIIEILRFCLNPDLLKSKLFILNFLYDRTNIAKTKHKFIKSLISVNRYSFFNELKKINLHFDHTTLTKSSLYESIEYIIYCFKLNNNSNSYIQNFLDFTFDYSINNFANIRDFLNHYDSKKDSLSIIAPLNSNAVNIMTIHKSKGLEFPIIIYPFADLDIYKEKNAKEWVSLNNEEFEGFNNFLVNFNNDFKYFDNTKEIYYNHKSNQELDNINLLYVTMTRSRDELHVISSKSSIKKEKNITKYSEFFISYLKSQNLWDPKKNIYEFGQRSKSSINDSKSNFELMNDFIIVPKELHKISIDAKSAKIWGSKIEKATNDGNLLHDLMYHINSLIDLKSTIENFHDSGILDFNSRIKYTDLITRILEHKKLKPYYVPSLVSFNEKEILIKDQGFIRIDRLVFLSKTDVCIIDYKTGVIKKKDFNQMYNYEKILVSMGYKIKKKIIVSTLKRLEVIIF